MRRTILLTLLVFVLGLCLSGNLFGREVGVTDKEIVIGCHSDLSGPIAVWGVPWTDGFKMRAKEINEAGGVLGRKIRMVIEDNAYDPKKAIMVTNKMITRDKVFMFLGNMGSPTAGATKPIISRKKIPQLAPATAASLFFDPLDRYSFGMWVPYYDQARAVVKYFVKIKGIKKLGAMYQDDEMGSIMMKGFNDQMKVYNLKLLSAESYKRGATDFSTQIAKLRKAGVEVVLLATIVRETVGALKEAQKIGWKVKMAGLSPTLTKFVPGLALKAGISPDGFIAAGQTPIIYEDSPLECVRKFWKRHVEMFGKDPDTPTVAGYYSLSIVAIAAEKVGRDLTREKFIDSLEKNFRNYPDDCFGGPPITYTPTNHQGASSVLMQEVQNGKFRSIFKGYIDYRTD
jgi:ABC-type branched-subunit amino acid transport system substrate-binding protein